MMKELGRDVPDGPQEDQDTMQPVDHGNRGSMLKMSNHAALPLVVRTTKEEDEDEEETPSASKGKGGETIRLQNFGLRDEQVCKLVLNWHHNENVVHVNFSGNKITARMFGARTLFLHLS